MPKETKLKSQPYSSHTQPVIRTSTALTASMLSKTVPSVMGESFLNQKTTNEKEVTFWGAEGYQPHQTNLSLDQALHNLSTVGDTSDEDHAMLAIVNDVFRASDFSNEEAT